MQTRAPLVTRDTGLLAALPGARVSFSLTTNREEVRRWYEPHCAPLAERVGAMKALRAAGIRVFATLAPVLPCDPDALVDAALEASNEDVIADPFHVRQVKKQGATMNLIVGTDWTGVLPVKISAITQDYTANVNSGDEAFCASYPPTPVEWPVLGALNAADSPTVGRST